jgi:hypothetical protein
VTFDVEDVFVADSAHFFCLVIGGVSSSSTGDLTDLRSGSANALDTLGSSSLPDASEVGPHLFHVDSFLVLFFDWCQSIKSARCACPVGPTCSLFLIVAAVNACNLWTAPFIDIGAQN